VVPAGCSNRSSRRWPRKPDATVATVDVDANQQLAGAYGVRGVPTLVVFADSEQVEEIVGVQGDGQLRSLIGRYTG
jgi:thioredoxin 1